VAGFASRIDDAAGVHEPIRIFGIDGRERRAGSRLQSSSALCKRGRIRLDEMLDFRGTQLTRTRVLPRQPILVAPAA
jgi:hypothetical protein